MKKLVVLTALAVGLCSASGAYAQVKGYGHKTDVRVTVAGNGNGNRNNGTSGNIIAGTNAGGNTIQQTGNRSFGASANFSFGGLD